MVKNCCVESCSSEFYPGCGISFFSFPRNDNARQQWLEVVPFKSQLTQENMHRKLVCSRHFKHTDIKFHFSKLCLNSEAVPSIFPNIKEWDQQVYHYIDKKPYTDEESEHDELENSNSVDKIMVVKPLLEDKRIEDIISTKSQSIKKPKMCDVSTETRHYTTRREEILKIKIHTLQATLRRRKNALNRLRAILRLIKHKCKTYDEVKKVLSLKLSEVSENVI